MITAEMLFNAYRGKRLLLDANLLLLFLIGTFDRALILRFKRTAGFSPNDFDVLANLLPFFRQLVTTPHVLTEVSSLANALPERVKKQWHMHIRQQTTRLFEIMKPSLELMMQPAYLTFGLADASIIAAGTDTLILTDDFRLSGFMRSRSLPVINLRDILAFSDDRSIGTHR